MFGIKWEGILLEYPKTIRNCNVFELKLCFQIMLNSSVEPETDFFAVGHLFSLPWHAILIDHGLHFQ